MKKIFVLISSLIFATSVIAQDYKSEKNIQKEKSTNDAAYCALLKDGKIMLMAEGRQVNAEVSLANGTKIKTDGTVVKKDGTEILLKNGECVDKEGNLISPKEQKKEESKMPPK